MSFLVNSNVNIFPVTNQRDADSTAHYLNEPHLVKWLLQLVDRKSFVTTPDVVINTTGGSDDLYFDFFIDGYYLSVKQNAIKEWIQANGNPTDIYAFLNIYDDYVLGDNIVASGVGAVFLGLELTTNSTPNSSVQLDSDPETDTTTSISLHILTKQSDGSYIVPKASKLKFESYSINVDGGEV